MRSTLAVVEVPRQFTWIAIAKESFSFVPVLICHGIKFFVNLYPINLDGLYHGIWVAMQDDPELTAVVRSRQLHVYRNGKKVLVLAGKAAPKVIREDVLCEMLYKYNVVR